MLNILLLTERYYIHPYEKTMSGICPEYVPKVYQNNNVHFRDIFRTYSEHPSVRNMFQNVIVSGHSFCPEYIIVLNFSKLLLYWTVYGHFQDIFLIFSGHMVFSGHFQDIFRPEFI